MGIERETKVETIMLRFVGVVLLCTLVLCGFGALHVAHNREKARWSRLLQQKEKELAQMTQRYREMETLVAMRSVQDLQQPAVLSAVVRKPIPSPSRGAQRGLAVAYAPQTQKPGKVALPQSRSVALAKATTLKAGTRS